MILEYFLSVLSRIPLSIFRIKKWQSYGQYKKSYIWPFFAKKRGHGKQHNLKVSLLKFLLCVLGCFYEKMLEMVTF